MPSISTLLTELEAALRAIYPTIAFGLGEKDLSRQDLAPPRIVWIPTTVKHGPAEKQRTNPRRLLTREVSIVAHCWAVDTSSAPTPLLHYDACEAVVHNLLGAIHKAGWGTGIRLGGEEWMQSQHIDLGHAALVTFMPEVPVLAQVYATAQPTGLQPDAVGAVPGDQKIDWGES
jgi:hypothetical protein